MNVRITFFNVGHGDSIVIEQLDNERIVGTILIDSNLINGCQPAYDYLKKSGTKVLNAIIISHIDYDHYSGIEFFLKEFDVKQLYIPPIFSVKSSRFRSVAKQIAAQLKEKFTSTLDETIKGRRISLAELLKFINNNTSIVEELTGRESILRIPDLPELCGKVYLPLPVVKGRINKILDSGNFDIDFFPNNNDMSIAIEFIFDGIKILFTGDSPESQWTEHKRQMNRCSIHSLDIDFLKSPHHGSEKDNTKLVYDYFFGNSASGKHIFISAPGNYHHPSKSVLELTKSMNISTHCTNFSCVCSSSREIDTFNSLPPLTKMMLSNYPTAKVPIACKGHITLNINNGSHSISSQNETYCFNS